MTVQVSAGPISIGVGDFIRTDRGVTWAIKARGGDFNIVMVCQKQSDGTWGFSDHPAEGMLDDSINANSLAMTPMAWFTNVFMPRLNAWLHTQFGKTEAPPVLPPGTGTWLEQADALINTRLQITVGADGYLNASLKS